MKVPRALAERLAFLSRVIDRERQHLAQTDQRLFCTPMTPDTLSQFSANSVMTERLDAFVSRFGRLQDTLGDKFLPALLSAMAEPVGPAIDNFDRAEKLGLIPSADSWMEMRHLRNQMVHEYIEDLSLLASALRTAHDFVPQLLIAVQRCQAQAQRLLD